MTVDELSGYLRENRLKMKEELLNGEYQPQAVKRVETPKPGNKDKRKTLEIPSAIDRFVQQATLHVLQREWDKTFFRKQLWFSSESISSPSNS